MAEPKNECERVLDITHGEIGVGGAPHLYAITGYDPTTNPEGCGVGSTTLLLFQNGAIAEAGVNGITHESLLEVLIHRLASFQSDRFACAENEMALYHLRCAMGFLNARTAARKRRGVEGTTQP